MVPIFQKEEGLKQVLVDIVSITYSQNWQPVVMFKQK